MKLWDEIVWILVKVKEFFLGLSAEQITLISVGMTLIIFMAGQRSETKFKKHEVRRAEYKKFIELLQKSLSGAIRPDEKGKREFFDTGVSLLLYGSKRVYKKYIFFREYSTNPIVQNSKHNDKKVLLYVVADILKDIRHEVGLTNLSELESNDALAFFVNDIGTNPLSRIEAYKSRYNILMIKSEIFFDNHCKLLTTKKVYYHVIKPIFGVVLMGLKYLLMPIVKVLNYVKEKPVQQEKLILETAAQEKDRAVNDKSGDFCPWKKQGFFQKVFALEWKAQRWVVQKIWVKSKLIGKVDVVCVIAFMIGWTLMATEIIPFKVASWILTVLGMAMLICTFLKDSQKAMTTLEGFLQLGMCLIAVVGIVLLFATAFTDILEGAIGQYLSYIIISFALSLIWGVYSSFCSAGVATLANALLAGVIGIVILTKDLLVDTLFVELVVSIYDCEIIAQMEAVGYSASQFIDAAFSLVFYPSLLMTGFATMVCAAKKYWIDKHNGHQDIDMLV